MKSKIDCALLAGCLCLSSCMSSSYKTSINGYEPEKTESYNWWYVALAVGAVGAGAMLLSDDSSSQGASENLQKCNNPVITPTPYSVCPD